MRAQLVPHLRCLCCRRSNFEVRPEKESDEIEVGTLVCGECGRIYRIDDGMVLMLDQVSATMAREISGWHKFAEDEKWGDPPDDYLLWLPRPRITIPTDTLHWEWHADNFELGLSTIDCRDRFVLDLAAGRCWTTRLLAERGATCVATDMLLTENIGLRTGKRYIRHTGTYFERVACSILDLPFRDSAFDVVFGYASLHHCEDLSGAICEAVRVLKPGGEIVLAGEPVGRFYESVQRWLKRHAYDLHETSPRLAQWLRPLRKAGVRQIAIHQDAVFTRHGAHIFDRVSRPLARLWPGFYRLKLRYLGGVLVLRGVKEKMAREGR